MLRRSRPSCRTPIAVCACFALARADAEAGEFGRDAQFVEVWARAADTLTSYTDSGYVAEDYARELTGARAQAVEVEQLSDDPPERVQAWLATVTEPAIEELGLAGSARLGDDRVGSHAMGEMAEVAIAEAERRTLIGTSRRFRATAP